MIAKIYNYTPIQKFFFVISIIAGITSLILGILSLSELDFLKGVNSSNGAALIVIPLGILALFFCKSKKREKIEGSFLSFGHGIASLGPKSSPSVIPHEVLIDVYSGSKAPFTSSLEKISLEKVCSLIGQWKDAYCKIHIRVGLRYKPAVYYLLCKNPEIGLFEIINENRGKILDQSHQKFLWSTRGARLFIKQQDFTYHD